MTFYVYDKALDKMVEVTEQPRRPQSGPYIIRDTPGYRSPLGTGWIEGRAARREDMARGDCREVDPSERISMMPKTESQAAAERASLADRQTVNLDPQTKKRLGVSK